MTAMSVHPAFDPLTMTWFADGVPDCSSLAEMQRLRPRSRIVGYCPQGTPHEVTKSDSNVRRVIMPITPRVNLERIKLANKINQMRLDVKRAERAEKVKKVEKTMTVPAREIDQGKSPHGPGKGRPGQPRLKARQFDHERVLDMWQSGAHIEAIAQAVDCGTYSIGDIVRVARHHDDPRAIRRKRVTKKNLPWSRDDIRSLRRLVEVNGLSASLAAAKIGRTRNSVIGKCHREGIKLGG